MSKVLEQQIKLLAEMDPESLKKIEEEIGNIKQKKSPEKQKEVLEKVEDKILKTAKDWEESGKGIQKAAGKIISGSASTISKNLTGLAKKLGPVGIAYAVVKLTDKFTSMEASAHKASQELSNIASHSVNLSEKEKLLIEGRANLLGMSTKEAGALLNLIGSTVQAEKGFKSYGDTLKTAFDNVALGAQILKGIDPQALVKLTGTVQSLGGTLKGMPSVYMAIKTAADQSALSTKDYVEAINGSKETMIKYGVSTDFVTRFLEQHGKAIKDGILSINDMNQAMTAFKGASLDQKAGMVGLLKSTGQLDEMFKNQLTGSETTFDIIKMIREKIDPDELQKRIELSAMKIAKGNEDIALDIVGKYGGIAKTIKQFEEILKGKGVSKESKNLAKSLTQTREEYQKNFVKNQKIREDFLTKSQGAYKESTSMLGKFTDEVQYATKRLQSFFFKGNESREEGLKRKREGIFSAPLQDTGEAIGQGIGSVQKLFSGLFGKRAKGGIIPPGEDTLIGVQRGEYVVNKESTARNKGLLDHINKGGEALGTVNVTLPLTVNGTSLEGTKRLIVEALEQGKREVFTEIEKQWREHDYMTGVTR